MNCGVLWCTDRKEPITHRTWSMLTSAVGSQIQRASQTAYLLPHTLVCKCVLQLPWTHIPPPEKSHKIVYSITVYVHTCVCTYIHMLMQLLI